MNCSLDLELLLSFIDPPPLCLQYEGTPIYPEFKPYVPAPKYAPAPPPPKYAPAPYKI